ncbi:histidine kinase [Bernardetia sp.]|uniref:tetratricopeptide repeat-containing sensor histidine kinase n=1 Tax=Bernardetia sp. TaxID=1937974 RepID=UPI0025C04143|nr:histidine kinase [Bernardetia sp.]
MRTIFICLFIFSSLNIAQGQSNKILDSLENVYNNLSTNNEKVDMLMRLYHASSSKKHKNKITTRLREIYLENEDTKVRVLLDYFDLDKRVEKRVGITPTLIDTILQIEKRYVTKTTDANMTHIWGLISKAYKYANQLDLSLTYQLKIIKALEAPKLLSNDLRYKQSCLAVSYIELAELYSLAKDSSAMIYSEKGVKMMEKMNFPLSSLAPAYANYAITLRRFGKYESALSYAKKAKEIIYSNKNYEHSSRKIQIVHLLTSIYSKMGKVELAIKEIDNAVYFTDRDTVSAHLNMLLYMKGKLLQSTKQYKSASEVFRQTIKYAEVHHTLDMLYNSHGKLSEVLYELKDYKGAFQALNKTSVYMDSINKKRRMKEVKELQTKYETEKKEQQIKELEQQNKIEKLEVEALEKQRLVLGLSFLAPLGFIFAGGWYVNRRRLRMQLEAEQKERAKELSELKALRSQMNPHFIFNALNSIQDFIMLSEKENAQHYLGKFAILMRGFLDSSSKETISLEKELPLLKSYIELEGLRLGEDFEYEINFDEKTDEDELDEIEIPPLLIQPYLENAFKHGLLHKTGEKKLILAFNKIQKDENNFLQLKITDNGVGRQKSAEINARKRKTHQSFATQATSERLELLKNQSITNRNIEVEIDDLEDSQGNPKGTEVLILIPINND